MHSLANSWGHFIPSQMEERPRLPLVPACPLVFRWHAHAGGENRESEDPVGLSLYKNQGMTQAGFPGGVLYRSRFITSRYKFHGILLCLRGGHWGTTAKSMRGVISVGKVKQAVCSCH